MEEIVKARENEDRKAIREEAQALNAEAIKKRKADEEDRAKAEKEKRLAENRERRESAKGGKGKGKKDTSTQSLADVMVGTSGRHKDQLTQLRRATACASLATGRAGVPVPTGGDPMIMDVVLADVPVPDCTIADEVVHFIVSQHL
eukprot:3352809-Amphidinium_carterae.1